MIGPRAAADATRGTAPLLQAACPVLSFAFHPNAMSPQLRERFDRLALRLAELDATLADPAIAADMKRWRTLSREQSEVQGVVERWHRYGQRERDLEAAKELRESELNIEAADVLKDPSLRLVKGTPLVPQISFKSPDE